MSVSKKKILALALLLYFFTLAFRIPGITEPAPQPDERHWQSRSYQLVRKLKAKDFAHLTDHIGHPGVTPSWVMGVGEILGDKLNVRRGLNDRDPRFISHLQSSRIANALVSSFVVPAVFLGVLPFLGIQIALFAAMLFALDPQSIALSRIAHLDSMMGLTATLTVMLYALAVKYQKLGLKLLAGVAWGLSMLTKPTALTLIPALCAYRGLRSLIARKNKISGEGGLVRWGDVWLVLTGMLVMIPLFTRLWHHDGPLRTRFRVGGKPADFVYQLGKDFGLEGSIVAGLGFLVIFIFVGLWSCRSKEQGRMWQFHSSMFALVLCLFSGLLVIFPAVLENLIRFYAWTLGLSGYRHESYGIVWTPAKYGYFSLLATKLPTVAIVGFCIGAFYLLVDFVRNRDEVKSERWQYLVFMILVVFAWVIPLNISSKQALRYVTPILGCLYVVAAYGFVRFLSGVTSRLGFRYLTVRSLLLVTLLVQALHTASWFPEFSLFHNAPSGGLAAAVERGEALPFVAQDEAVAFLHKAALRAGRPLFIYVLGDPETLSYTYYRHFPNQKLLKFYRPTDVFDADFVLAFSSFYLGGLEEIRRSFNNSKPVYEYSFKGQSVMSIFEVPTRSFEAPGLLVPIAHLPRLTGREIKIDPVLAEQSGVSPGMHLFRAMPSTDRANYLLHGKYVRVPAGKYEVSFLAGKAALEIEDVFDPAWDSEQGALKFEFGGSCSRVLKASELREDKLQRFSLTCELSAARPVQLRAYWWGTARVVLGDMEIERLKD